MKAETVFTALNNANITYALLRDFQNSPACLPTGEDIDLIVAPVDAQRLRIELTGLGFIRRRHPWDFGNNFIFLYGLPKFEWYELGGLKLDICEMLCCRSLGGAQWLPLHADIQSAVWQNICPPVTNNEPAKLGSADQLLHLITRAVFDKREFPQRYRIEIERLLQQVPRDAILWRLRLVFYSFSESLYDELQAGRYERLLFNYIAFDKY